MPVMPTFVNLTAKHAPAGGSEASSPEHRGGASACAAGASGPQRRSAHPSNLHLPLGEVVGSPAVHGMTPYLPGTSPLASMSARKRVAQMVFSYDEGTADGSAGGAEGAGLLALPVAGRPASPGRLGSPLPPGLASLQGRPHAGERCVCSHLQQQQQHWRPQHQAACSRKRLRFNECRTSVACVVLWHTPSLTSAALANRVISLTCALCSCPGPPPHNERASSSAPVAASATDRLCLAPAAGRCRASAPEGRATPVVTTPWRPTLGQWHCHLWRSHCTPLPEVTCNPGKGATGTRNQTASAGCMAQTCPRMH